MAWSVDAEINWARFHSCRSHPRKRRERSLRVREACDLQSNRLGYLNTTPPMRVSVPELRASSVLPRVPPTKGVLIGRLKSGRLPS